MSTDQVRQRQSSKARARAREVAQHKASMDDRLRARDEERERRRQEKDAVGHTDFHRNMQASKVAAQNVPRPPPPSRPKQAAPQQHQGGFATPYPQLLKGQGKGKDAPYTPPVPPPPPMASSKTAPTEPPNSLFGIDAPQNPLRHVAELMHDDAAAGAPPDEWN